MDPDSAKFLVINTHKGLFQYNRLPFGVASAPSIFQNIMDQVIAGVPGTAAYLDDIIVTGVTQPLHQQNLELLLQRLEAVGFHVKPAKCSFMQPTIHYLGFIIDSKGLHTDPAKTSAITKMPRPHDVSTLRAYLGLINHYGKFLPRLHELRAPFDNLLKKEVKWCWSDECETAFKELRETLTSPLFLAHFDPDKPLYLAADASNAGVGAVIYHKLEDGRETIIAQASKTLTTTEQRYSQIEKEGLAIIFGIKKFHRYLHGRTFTLLTDHKPLVSIFGSKKGVPPIAANRLQRWCILLLSYKFKIEYRRTTDFGQVDPLSRLPHGLDAEFDTEQWSYDHQIYALWDQSLEDLPLTAYDIATETQTDKTLNIIKQYTLKSWPNKTNNSNLRAFFSLKANISIQDNCLLFNNRIIIPASLRSKVLYRLHETHPGMSRMKALARQKVWWPRMDCDIEELVNACSSCAATAKLPPVETQSWPKTERPWQRLHADFADLDGKQYLLIVDAHSKWPEAIPMNSTDAVQTIKAISNVFATHGLPEQIVTDNGPQFSAGKFQNFCRSNGIIHTFSPPFHPRSNGLAERFVDTFKRAMKKGDASSEEQRRQLFLFTYRTTPHSTTKKTPSELLMGRQLRSTLDLLHPESVATEIRKQRLNGDLNGSKTTTDTTPNLNYRKQRFNVGDAIWLRFYKLNKADEWTPGVVTGKRGTMLYEVKSDDKLHVRHQNQLRRRVLTQPLTNIKINPARVTHHPSPQNRNQTKPPSTATAPVVPQPPESRRTQRQINPPKRFQ